MAVGSAANIHEMVNMLTPGGWHHIAFQVGKLGRVDRFVLMVVRPGEPPEELLALTTEPGKDTEDILTLLDDLVDKDEEFGVIYSNHPRNAYCHWSKPIDSGFKRPEWATQTKISPLYSRRMAERERVCSGSLKRGHREFGFFPLDGYR